MVLFERLGRIRGCLVGVGVTLSRKHVIGGKLWVFKKHHVKSDFFSASGSGCSSQLLLQYFPAIIKAIMPAMMIMD